jgi:hypothetical protein
MELCCSPQAAALLSAPAEDQAVVENGKEKDIPWAWIAAAALGAGALVWFLKR